MAYTDIERKREYQREWTRKKLATPEAKKARSEYMRAYRHAKNGGTNRKIKSNAIRLRELKETLCCIVCGENEPVTLDFHHLDPASKDINISRMVRVNTNWDEVLEEINKCVVLCSNCHRKLHAGVITL